MKNASVEESEVCVGLKQGPGGYNDYPLKSQT